MKWLASLSLALLVLSFTAAQDDKKDNEKFQGKWNMAKGEMNGESLPEDAAASARACSASSIPGPLSDTTMCARSVVPSA